MKEYTGKIAQRGYTAGKIYIFSNNNEVEKVISEPTAEIEKYHASKRKFINDLRNEISKTTKDNVGILEFGINMIENEDFDKAVIDVINMEKINAEYAVSVAGNGLKEQLLRADDKYIQERVVDIKGIINRLIMSISGKNRSGLNTPAIVVADELSPSDISAMKEENILGIVTRKGSPTSHVSIMAGNIGIPYIYDCDIEDTFFETEADETNAILEGDKGLFIWKPSEEEYLAAVDKARVIREEMEKQAALYRNTTIKTKVYANISGPKDIDKLLENNVAGVGLFRSEFLFLNQSMPSEEEQYEAYKAVLEAMKSKEVVIRTMDIGSDKKAPWMNMGDEKNPALGNRGLRLSLKNEDIFVIQIRALLRAAVFGNLKVMFPMIVSEWEVDKAKEIVEKVAKQLDMENIKYAMPKLGIMIETPAAALIAEDLAGKVDFFSIGTNDLTQYTTALDREAEGLGEFYQPYHEAVFKLIDMVTKAAHKNGIETAICGELGSDPYAIKRIVQIGVDEVSVSITKIAKTIAKIAEAEGDLPKELDKNIDSRVSDNITKNLCATADGVLIPMEEIPDKVFSQGTMGECFGIIPEDSKVYAPCDGTVINVADTKHAIVFENMDNQQILVHVGIDTVKLKGKGFKVHVKEGDKVMANQLVLEFDRESIKKAGYLDTVVTILI